MTGISYEEINLPADVKLSYKTMMKYFNLNFCTSDYIISKDGKFYFLENNPNGQWAWIGIDGKNDLISWFARIIALFNYKEVL